MVGAYSQSTMKSNKNNRMDRPDGADMPHALATRRARFPASQWLGAGLLALAALGTVTTAQAQTYRAPASFVSGTNGSGGASTFNYGADTNVTVTFTTATSTAGGVYGYGIRTANATIGGIGSNSNAFLSGATTASLSSTLDVWGFGCPIPGIEPGTSSTDGRVCMGRGTLTIRFNQPVVNPIIHLGGLGTAEVASTSPLATGLRYNAVYNLTNATNGAATVPLSLTSMAGNATLRVAGTTVDSSRPVTSVDASCAASQAACGSVRFNGTVDVLVFNVGVRGYGTQAQELVIAPPFTPGINSGYAQSQDNRYSDGHSVSASIVPNVDLTVTKTNNQTVYTPGQTVTYTILVSNVGINTVIGATVLDNLPAALTGTSWTAAYSTGASGPTTGSGSINSTITLPPAGTATFTVTATVSPTATGNLTNTVTVDLPTGFTDPTPANNTATDTDTPAARVTIRKVSLGGVGAFAFSGTNGVPAETITTVTDGTAVSGTVRTLTTAGVATTLTETPLAGYALSGIACTGLATGGTATPNLVAGSVLLNVAATAAGANIVCTFTNTKQPVLRLQKALPSGRLIAADQFALTIAGAGGPATVTTTGTTTTPTQVATLSPATVGSSYTLSEAAAGGAVLTDYTSTYSCTNARAGSAAGSTGSTTSFNFTPAAGDDLTCTFSNASIARADLSIVKTSNVPTVQAGGLIIYTLTAANAGPSAANGAVIRDAPGVGLDCTTPSTTATCTASGGAVCPGATVLVSNLLGAAGVTIATFPPGGSVVITLQCRVTASGTP